MQQSVSLSAAGGVRSPAEFLRALFRRNEAAHGGVAAALSAAE